MSISQATLELLIALKDNASAGLSSLGGALGNVGAIAGGAALAGVVAFGAALVGGVQDAQASRALLAETETIIKNTGGAAGVSAQQVVDLSAALSDAAGKSLFGDDQIQGAENVILKFKEIKVPLADVTQLSLDMAQALGTAPADAARKLGLALQDPFNAVTDLQKQGVILTDTQKAVLDQFKATGDAAGAQAVLVDALNATYGGQAAAAAKAAGGMVQFKAGLGEAFETLGSKLLPVLDKFGAWLNSPEVQTSIAMLADQLSNGIGVAAAWLSDTAIPALQKAWTDMQPTITTLSDNISVAAAGVSEFVGFLGHLVEMFKSSDEWSSNNAETIASLAAEFIAFFTGIEPYGDTFNAMQHRINDFTQAIQVAADWIGENLPPAIAAAQKAWTDMQPAIQATIAFIQSDVMPVLAWLTDVVIKGAIIEIKAIGWAWSNIFLPAIKDVISFITTYVAPAIATIYVALRDDLPRGIALAMQSWADFKTALSDFKTGYIDPIVRGWNEVTGAVSGAFTWFDKISASINGIQIPSWLQGHSPPPLANWFSDIAGAAESAGGAVTSVAPLGGTVPALPAFGAGAGAPGGQINVYVTVQGNVSTERDLVLAIRDGLSAIGRQNVTIFAGQT